MARSGPGSRGGIQSGIRGLREAREITRTDLWTKSQADEMVKKATMTVPPELRHFRRNEQIWEELVFHDRLRMKSNGVNEWNVSHLQILLIETLYYELYCYGY